MSDGLMCEERERRGNKIKPKEVSGRAGDVSVRREPTI